MLYRFLCALQNTLAFPDSQALQSSWNLISVLFNGGDYCALQDNEKFLLIAAWRLRPGIGHAQSHGAMA